MQKKSDAKKAVVSSDAYLKALTCFRAISHLEGMETSDADRALLRKLAEGRITKQDYVFEKCRKAS